MEAIPLTEMISPAVGRPIRVLVIDNYDSFVYNLVHYLEELDCQVTVWRNNEIDMERIADFDKILLSPGPGIPEEAGLLKQVIAQYASSKSILGVCLGQQAIGEVFGGQLVNLSAVFHGVSSKIRQCVPDEQLFAGLEEELEVGRYHSWIVDRNLPLCLEATSYDENGQVMSLRHKEFDVRGVQFHPESVLTPQGKKMLENWVRGKQPVIGGSQSVAEESQPEAEGSQQEAGRSQPVTEGSQTMTDDSKGLERQDSDKT